MLMKSCFFDNFSSSVNLILQPFLILSMRTSSRLATFFRLPLEEIKIYLRQAPQPPGLGGISDTVTKFFLRKMSAADVDFMSVIVL